MAKCSACSLHIHLALTLVLMHEVCPPTLLAQPTSVTQDVLNDAQQRECAELFSEDTTKSACRPDLMYCLKAQFFFLLCTAKHVFYKKKLTKVV